MDWPSHSIESIPSDAFTPVFCPRPACSQHNPAPASSFRYKRLKASFLRKCDGRLIRRFRCSSCKSSFSTQSFAASYYLKRPELTVPIAQGVVNGAAHRQIARMAGCAPSTVTKRIARLGRHAQLLHQICLSSLTTLAEPVNYDDFETFTGTQYHPCSIGTSIGHHSWFLYGLSHAPHRRTGHLSPAQRKRQAVWDRKGGKPPRDPYACGLTRHLVALLPKAGEHPLRLITDDMKGYARAIRRHPRSHSIRQSIHPNPKRGPKGSRRTPQARARDEAMHPIDALHGFFRHSVKAHTRETIAFGRRSEAQLERAYVFLVFRNLVKRRSERRPRAPTPAQWLGLTDDRWSWQKVFAMRLQPSRLPGGAAWPELYARSMLTPTLEATPPHRLKLAY